MYTFRFTDVLRYGDVLIDGAVRSVGITALTAALGLAVGTACALMNIYGPARARLFIAAYVELFRNTPFIVQLFFIFFGLASIGLRMTAWVAAIVALTVNFGAYTAEIMRGGILGIPPGQLESATSLGLSPWQTFSSVIAFQAVRNVYASLTSYVVLLFLGSSIVSQISVQELFYSASYIESRTFRSFESYLVICGIYLAIVVLLRLAAALCWHLFFAGRG